MTLVVVLLLIWGSFALGVLVGMALAIGRTDRTIAAMSEDEIRALALRVRRRKGLTS